MSVNHFYLIALGSNKRHVLLGSPAHVLEHAIAALEMADVNVFSHSRIIGSRPIGPSKRLFANAAVLISSALMPNELLARLQQIETHFGKRARGQRWGDRVLDLDIILWSGGMWTNDNPALAIPHSAFQNRHFVLQPASQIASDWRDPVTGKSISQLLYRINRSKRVDPRVNQH